MTSFFYNETKDNFVCYSEMLEMTHYPENENSFYECVADLGYMQITKGKAKEFWRDLLGTLGTNGSSGVMPTEMIAERMKISFNKAKVFMYACAYDFDLTETQNGMWVV